ncbi:TY-Chap2 family putative peptide chaperone [Agromyces arachidis]|uniref:TY-Chap2 family putative peptide chaperone n=1 Tax=Agromyces arachidis TaxID=766966 RepID=UPI00405780A5
MGDEVPWGYVQPASRFQIEQSWWIASELARRHPTHIVYEAHPGGGLGDELWVRPAGRLTDGDRWIRINRGGTIRVVTHRDDNAHVEGAVAHLADALAAADPHHLLKQIEAAANLSLTDPAPSSTGRSLAYRFISSALTMMLNDRHPWDCRNCYYDTAGYGTGPLDYLEAFPDARADARAIRSEPWDLGNREAHFWALLRQNQPLALLSSEGRLYFRGRVTDLMSEYPVHDRDLRAMVVDLFLAGLGR